MQAMAQPDAIMLPQIWFRHSYIVNALGHQFKSFVMIKSITGGRTLLHDSKPLFVENNRWPDINLILCAILEVLEEGLSLQ